MPIGVVDLFEMVQVGQDKAARQARTAGAFHFFFEGAEEVAEIVETCEWVDLGLLSETLALLTEIDNFSL
jgi:hypothetical protein